MPKGNAFAGMGGQNLAYPVKQDFGFPTLAT
jgi:hypothetical protein